MLKSSLAPWQRDAWRQIAGPAETYPAALLIAGPRGIGKEELSRFVAKGLLCEDPYPGFEPCGRCVACQWCDQGAHPDLKRLESEALARDETAIENNDDRRKRADKKVARQISVAQVRELSGFLSLTPHRRGSKVVMVIPAEELSPSAANALLKTLEEPPPKTVFLLVTHQPHRILPTVRSRCRILPMRAPPQEQGMAWLAERGVSDPEVLLAEAGYAPMRAFDNATGDQLALRKRFLSALAGRGIDPIEFAGELDTDNVQVFLGWLQQWVYDLAANRLVGRTRYNVDYADPLKHLAVRSDLPRLFGLYRSLVHYQSRPSHPLNPKLLLEQVFVSYFRCVQDCG